MKPVTDTLLPHPESHLELPEDRRKSLLSEIYGQPTIIPHTLPVTKVELESLLPQYENIEDIRCEMNYYTEVYEFD